MTTLRYWVLTFGALLAASSASAQALPTIDHFFCYFAPGELRPEFALLSDQFDVAPATIPLPTFERVTDLRSILFCNPAAKVHAGVTTPIQHPDAHLAMYRINPQLATPRLVNISNQFGTATLQTGAAEILAVPSGKTPINAAGTVPAALPPIPPATELNHFQCYAASGPDLTAPAAGPPVGVVVGIKDQFRSDFAAIEVLRPFLFCNPVTKITVDTTNPLGPVPVVTPILGPTAPPALTHMTCYLTTRVAFQGVVMYNNQFVLPGTLPTLTLGPGEVLCVPTAKLSWSVIQPSAAGTPTGAN